MKKALKITGIAILSVFILLLVIPLLFKGKIINVVKEEVGKTVDARIEFPDISISFIKNFPNLNVTLDQFSVAGKGRFNEDTLLTVKKISLTLDIMSVIKGEQYVIKKILIDEPVINLKVLGDSTANWDIVKMEPSKQDETSSDTSSAFSIAMNNFRINNATIVYEDKPNKTSASIAGLEFTLSGDLSAGTTTLKTESVINSLTVDYGNVRYMNKASVKFDAVINADMQNKLFTFEKNTLSVNDLKINFDGWVKMLEESYELDIKFNTPDTEFKSVLSMIPAIYSKQFSDVKTSGDFKLDGFAKGVYENDNLPAFGLELQVSDAMFQYPQLPASVKNINIGVSIANKGGSADNTLVKVEKFHTEIAGNPLDFTLGLATPVSDPEITFTALGKLDLSSIEKIYPLDQKLTGMLTANLELAGKMSSLDNKNFDGFKAIGSLQIENMATGAKGTSTELNIKSMLFKFSPAFLELASFEAGMGSSDIKASGKITQYLDYLLKNGTLKGVLSVTSSYLNVDELMPKTSNTTNSDSTIAGDNAPIELPERIDFTASCAITRMKYDKMELTNIRGQVTLRDKKLNLDDLTMNGFGGTVQTNGYIKTVKDMPIEVNITANLNQIDIQQLSASFSSIDSIAPILKKIKGNTSMSMNFNTSLHKDYTPDLSSVQSQGTLNTGELIANDIDVMNKAADMLKMENLRRIKVSPASLSYIIENGKLLVKPFDIKVNQIAGTLGGTTEISTQALDYVLGLQIPRTTFGSAANSVVDGLVAEINKKGIAYEPDKNVAINLSIGGTAKNPTIGMNLGKSSSGGSITEDLKAKASEEFNRKKQELENQAKAEVEKQKAAAEAKLKQEQEKLKAEAEKKKKELENKARKEADSLKKKLEDEAKKKLKKFF